MCCTGNNKVSLVRTRPNQHVNTMLGSSLTGHNVTIADGIYGDSPSQFTDRQSYSGEAWFKLPEGFDVRQVYVKNLPGLKDRATHDARL